MAWLRQRVTRASTGKCGAKLDRAPSDALLRGDERGEPGPHAEPARVVAVGRPDVDAGAADAATRVIDEEPAKEAAAGEQLDVAGEREDPRVGGDDAGAHGTAAARASLETVRGERDRDRLARPRAPQQA